MATSDKNIVITPNIGQTSDPKIVFSGADSVLGPQNITLQVYPTNNGTLSFEGSAGQLFSITNSLTGTIFSVNDVSGIPSIEVLDTGIVKLAQYSGRVLIGTGTDNGVDELQVNGDVLATSFKGNATTATTLTTTRTLWGQNFNGSANVTGALSSVTTLSMNNQLTNTLATGSAPFTITSTTRVVNLNVATAGTADTLTTARTIGGVSFNGSANINLPGVNTAGTQNTTGNARAISVPDTREVDDRPQDKLGNTITADFKNNTAVGLPPVNASTSFSHIITVAGWSSNEGSGGWPTQLSIGTNGIAYRQAITATSWSAWNSLVNTSTAQTVTGVKTFSSNISVPSAGVTSGSVSAGINLNAAGSGYLFGTSGDGASSTIANVKLTSWFGIGFSPSITGQAVPQWENAAWIDVRSGAISARNDITAYASDERLKTNFVSIQNPLEKLKSIGGYEFDWLMDKCRTLGFQPNNIHEHGVKAQEIQRVVPDAVTIAPFDDNGEKQSKSGENYLTVKYEKLVPLLIEAIKEQQTQIEELKNQTAVLQTMINTLIGK